MKKIKITCKGQQYVSIDSLKDFQENLKSLSDKNLEKLKNSIIKHGFSFPVFVWNKYIIDGHQRIYATKKLIEEGYTIGDIPIVEIDAKDRSEAAEKLLYLNSSYANITSDGLERFISENDLDIELFACDLDLPDFDIDKFIRGGVGDGDGEDYENNDKIDEKYNILIECENEKEQLNLLDRFIGEGLKCRALIS